MHGRRPFCKRGRTRTGKTFNPGTLGDHSTLADAILTRLVNRAHWSSLKGGTRRTPKAAGSQGRNLIGLVAGHDPVVLSLKIRLDQLAHAAADPALLTCLLAPSARKFSSMRNPMLSSLAAVDLHTCGGPSSVATKALGHLEKSSSPTRRRCDSIIARVAEGASDGSAGGFLI